MAATPWRIIPLELPVQDKTYIVQPLDYTDGFELHQVINGKSKKIKTTDANDVFFRLVMGGTWDEMLTDKCPWPVMFRAGLAASDYQIALLGGSSFEEAVAQGEAKWESGLDPEAVAAALERAATAARNTPQGSTRSPSTASGSATRQQAPTKPTTSRPGTPRRNQSRKPSASSGKRSSTTGR